MQPFIAAAVYAGSKPGYVFSMRDRGLGYYLDSSMTQPEAPAHWRAYRDANNQLYWAREDTNDARWTKPAATAAVSVDDFPEDEVLKNWRAHRAGVYDDELYFINLLTGARQWTRPPGFLGMPVGEEEDHARGPFVAYVDAEGARYFYNPRTKLSTRTEPASELAIPEEVAFPPLSARDVDASEAPKRARSSSASSSSSSSSESASASDADDPRVAAFNALLERKRVTRASRWPNWIARLQGDAAFAALPNEQRRARFEAFVRLQAAARDEAVQSVLEAACNALAAFAHSEEGRRALAAATPTTAELPPAVAQALARLDAAEREVALAEAIKAAR